MKTLFVVTTLVSAAYAGGSGPYLPSGWRPSGPAFFLPNEVERTSPIPLKDVPLQESGSDFLREYGPPKLQDITKQYLPEVATEKAFIVIEEGNNGSDGELAAVEIVKEDLLEATTPRNMPLNSAVVQSQQTTETIETQTQIIPVEVITDKVDTTYEGRAINVDVQALYETTQGSVVRDTEDMVTESDSANLQNTEDLLTLTTESQGVNVDQETQTETGNINENLKEVLSVTKEEPAPASSTEVSVKGTEESTVDQIEISEVESANSDLTSSRQQIETNIEAKEDLSKTVDSVNNIADALLKLENDIQLQQINSNTEIVESKTVDENTGSIDAAPEGFLEYGPPGFKEYGPPKEDIGSAPVQKPLSENLTENNAVRRRRFSPKLRASRKSLNKNFIGRH